MLDLRRRDFVTLLSGAAVGWPLVARAQQAGMPVIGFLSSRSPGESESLVAAFRRGLAEGGFVEGQKVSIAFRWAEGRYERLPTLAKDLVSLRVAVLFAAGGSPSALAARATTSTLPVVFAGVGDPLRAGLVAGLNRPGGNVTGMSVLTTSLGFAPSTTRVAALLQHGLAPNSGFLRALEDAAPTVGVQLTAVRVRDAADIEQGLGAFARQSNSGPHAPRRLSAPKEPRLPSPNTPRHGVLHPWLLMRKLKPPLMPCGRFARAAGRFTMMSYVPMLVRPSRLRNLRKSQNFKVFKSGQSF
jgi:putative ABC transport system substrate-binding protein